MRAGWVLFATDESDAGVSDARQWCRDCGLTGDDVRLVKRDGQCLVIAKREVRVKQTSCGNA